MSFVSYISMINTPNVENFKSLFYDDIFLLPDKCLSSKKIRMILNIDNCLKEDSFKETYLEYFKWKLDNN